MSKVRDFGFKPEHSQLLSARARTASAAAKVQVAEPEPKVAQVARNIEPSTKVEPKAERLRKALVALASVSNGDGQVKSGAARIARWRSKQDPKVRKQQNREAVQRHRAKKKAAAS